MTIHIHCLSKNKIYLYKKNIGGRCVHLRNLYFYFLYDFTNHRDFKGLKYGIQACKQVGFHRGRYVTMLSNRWLNWGFGK